MLLRTLLLTLGVSLLLACDPSGPVPSDAAITDGASVADDGGAAADAPSDAPIAPSPRCDDGLIVLHTGEEPMAEALAAGSGRWAIIYGATRSASAGPWLVMHESDGRQAVAPRAVASGTRIAAFGDGFLMVEANARGTLARLDRDGAPMALVPSDVIGRDETALSLVSVEGSEPTAMLLTVHVRGRSVYRVTSAGTTRVLELPVARASAVGMRGDAVLDVTIEDEWDGRPALRLYRLGDGAEPELALDVPAWEEGPQSLTSVHFQSGLWYVLGGRRDPDSRFYRGRIGTIARDTSIAPPIVFSDADGPSESLADGDYYAVAGGVAGDGSDAPGVLLSGSLGTLSADHVERFAHGLTVAAHIAFEPGSRRYGVVGRRGEALVLRCDLRPDGSHGAF